MSGEILPPYVLKRNSRSRRIRITVAAGGKVVVTAHKKISCRAILDFVNEKRAWILRQVDFFKEFSKPALSREAEEKIFLAHKVRAFAVATEKVFRWNASYGFPVGKISIRNNRSRWGSCSGKGNLSFNYKIVFLPEPLADYLVVHELCHLRERNHGERFWSLVSKTAPDYISRRKELRRFEKTFMPPVHDV